MLSKYKRNNFKIFFFLDVIFISVILYCFIKLQYKYFYPFKLDFLPSLKEIIVDNYKAYLLIIFLWCVVSSYIKLYTFKKIGHLIGYVKTILLQVAIISVVVFTISSLKSFDLFSNQLFIPFSLCLLFYLLLSRWIIYDQIKKRFLRGDNLKNVIVIGRNTNSKGLIKLLNTNKNFGLNIIEIIPDKIFDFNQLISSLNKNNIRYIFIFLSENLIQSNEIRLINYCENNHIKIYYISNYIPFNFRNLDVDYIDTIPIYGLKNNPLEETKNQSIKVLFDYIFAIFICVFVLSWMFPIIALLIKLDSKGEIIFKQKRRGFKGKVFDCYKFRTMYNDGTNSIQSTVVNDYRVTKIGKILRKTSLDELPQFINVLKGDMSTVGPRPHMISQDIYYSGIIQKYNIRNYVKPGITGLAQVKGFRGAINIDKDMEDRIRADVFYVRNWSLLLDIQIIFQTIVLLFKGDKNAI